MDSLSKINWEKNVVAVLHVHSKDQSAVVLTNAVSNEIFFQVD